MITATTIEATTLAHVHTAVGVGIPCDYSGSVVLLGAAEGHDECEVCACGSSRFSSFVNGELETLGSWGTPEDDAELLRSIFVDALGTFATA